MMSQAAIRDTLEEMIAHHRQAAARDDISIAERGDSIQFLNMVGNYYAQPRNRDGIVDSLYALIAPHYVERIQHRASARGRQDGLLGNKELLVHLGLLFGGLYCFKEVAVASLAHNDPATAIAYGLPGLAAFGSIIAWNYIRLRHAERQRRIETEQAHTMTKMDVITVLDAYANAIRTQLTNGQRSRT